MARAGATAHGARSRAAQASASSAPSPAGRPTSWTPSGRPSSPSIQRQRDPGLAAGVEDGRERREQPRAGEGRHRFGRRRVERPERQRALGERGGEQRVIRLQERDQAPCERPAAAPRRHALDGAQLLDHREDRPAHRLHVLGGRLAPGNHRLSRRSTGRCGWRRRRRTAPAGPSACHGGSTSSTSCPSERSSAARIGDRLRAHRIDDRLRNAAAASSRRSAAGRERSRRLSANGSRGRRRPGRVARLVAGEDVEDARRCRRPCA